MFFYIVRPNCNLERMMTFLFLAAASAYLCELLWFRRGLRKGDASRTVPGLEPTVSVIVAARNEEDRITDCLRSLAALEYPPEKIEIIIVDDRSTDRTAAIIRQFSSLYPAVRCVTSGAPEGNLQGKANAILHGIEASKGEILMFTDADCKVPPSWVRETVPYFDDATGVVGGFTLLDAGRPFEGMQQLDWIFLIGVASSAAGWNIPVTAIGNNLSIRRSAYDAVGGYREVPFSVTEDYALVQAILRKTNFKVQFPVNARTVVQSKACQSWKQLFRQKQRWVVGGLDMVPRGVFMMLVGWIYRFLLVASWPFVDSFFFVGVVALVMWCELLYLALPLQRFGSLRSIRFFPVFELYYLPLVLCSPFIAWISRNIVWKERTHRKQTT